MTDEDAGFEKKHVMAAWKQYQMGKRSAFDRVILECSLKQYPTLWKIFCETEELEGRKVKE